MNNLFSTHRILAITLVLTAALWQPAGAESVPSLLPQKPLAETAVVQASSPAPAPTKLGYIDMAKILSESTYGASIKSAISDKQSKLQSQIETKRKQLDKQKSAIEAKLQSLTPQQREAKGKEFQKKVEEFQKFGRGLEEELQKFQDEQQNRFMERLEAVCSEYGKGNGLSLIIVKKELLYLGSGVETQDISDAVIKQLDAAPAPKK